MLRNINTIILIIELLLVTFYDLKYKKIPNYITLPVILWGFISTTVANGLKGLQFSALGFAFGIAIFIIPFAFCMIGGGDVKLMGAIGSLMGWKFSLSSVLYGSLAGGLIAVIILLFDKSLYIFVLKFFSLLMKPLYRFLYIRTGKETFIHRFEYIDSKKITNKKKYLPYGAAIAAGSLLVLSGIVPNVVN